MIGALDSIEKSFGFLWQTTEGDMSAEQQELKKIFESTRSEILDRGNTQMRNLQTEFINYDITWKKYSLNLPVVKKKEKKKMAKDKETLEGLFTGQDAKGNDVTVYIKNQQCQSIGTLKLDIIKLLEQH